jgi:peptidoglycan/xylan/chitin deacetylase (PgdA/CDA1 family)
MSVVLWSLDINDSFVSDAQDLKKNISSARIRPGDIMLLHDDSKKTLDSLGDIISDIQARGYAFNTIGEMLK